MKKVAILYICTGNYVMFWDTFYRSAERYLLPHSHKHYFIFTDSQAIHTSKNISVIAQEKLGFPFDTLQRFHMFARISEQLKKFDYIFFFNANTRFGTYIPEHELLPTKVKHNGLVMIEHRWNMPGKFTFEERPESRAYVSQEDGKHYVWGALNGGEAKAYLAMIHELKRRTDEDSARGIIALWHDESHLNRYALDLQYRVKFLPIEYAIPGNECYPPQPIKRGRYKILLLAKEQFTDAYDTEKIRSFTRFTDEEMCRLKTRLWDYEYKTPSNMDILKWYLFSSWRRLFFVPYRAGKARRLPHVLDLFYPPPPKQKTSPIYSPQWIGYKCFYSPVCKPYINKMPIYKNINIAFGCAR